jgi:flagellar biosynthesis protein FlhA
MPGLPLIPFMFLGGCWPSALVHSAPDRGREQGAARSAQDLEKKVVQNKEEEKDSVKAVAAHVGNRAGCSASRCRPDLLGAHQELAFRVGKMRKKFATQYGFVVPEIKVTDDIAIPRSPTRSVSTARRSLRTSCASAKCWSSPAPAASRAFPGDEIREPAFGMPAVSILEAFAEDLKREGFQPIDNVSVVLTHLSEVIRNNLPQLLSYKDVKILIDRLDPEYKKLADEICSSHMSYSGLQAVLKLLLAERVSIRNLHLILEAVAELAPHVRKTEQIVEHVRVRMAQQICGDLSDNGVLRVLRLGNRGISPSTRRSSATPRARSSNSTSIRAMLEEFSEQATKVIREFMDRGLPFVLVTSPETRSYVRMIIERLFATLPVLSHVELAKGIEIKILGSIS